MDCPICDEELLEVPVPSQHRNVTRYRCTRCGDFEASDYALKDPKLKEVWPLVSAWVHRENKMGNKYPLVGGSADSPAGSWFQSLEYMGFPKTVNEKMDALLNSLADIVKDELKKPVKIHLHSRLIPDIAARNTVEVKALTELLHERGYIDLTSDYIAKIGVKGWDRIDEMRKSSYSSDSAFIAMWYDQCTDKYRDATVAAITHCRYKPLIVDQHEFSGFIMDQVISLIRQSRFLIADLTCRAEEDDMTNKVIKGVRGGVYWEAGFAYSLGKPVIHTCEDTAVAKRRIHFDLQQYKTIFWKSDQLDTNIRDLSSPLEDPNFTERLAANILATVGKGSYLQTQ